GGETASGKGSVAEHAIAGWRVSCPNERRETIDGSRRSRQAFESSLTHEEEQENHCAFGCQAAMSRRWSV
ncbi:unnamed protein product, partial [Musa hybrid cultivar]